MRRRLPDLALLTLLVLRIAACLLPAVGLGGDADGYVRAAYEIARTGWLPPARVQPHGISLFMAPLTLVFGQRVPDAMRLLQVGFDLVIVAGLVGLARAVFSGEALRWHRLAVTAVLLFQPFTAMFVVAIYTETLVEFLVFAAIWLLARRTTGRHPTIWLALAVALLSLAATCRVELAVFPLAIGLLAVALQRRDGVPRERTVVKDGGAAVAAFVAVFGGFVLYQYASSRDVGIVKARFHADGYMRWLRTWVRTQADTERFAFTILEPGGTAYDFSEYPQRAFENAQEGERVRALLGRMSEHGYRLDVDAAFAALGRERAQNHPFRAWLLLPLARVPAYWLNLQGPQTYLRAVDLPRAARWGLIGLVLLIKGATLALALVGAAWCFSQHSTGLPGAWIHFGQLAAIAVVLRQAELAALGTIAWAGLVESRYVLLAYPLVLALAVIGYRRVCTPRS